MKPSMCKSQKHCFFVFLKLSAKIYYDAMRTYVRMPRACVCPEVVQHTHTQRAPFSIEPLRKRSFRDRDMHRKFTRRYIARPAANDISRRPVCAYIISYYTYVAAGIMCSVNTCRRSRAQSKQYNNNNRLPFVYDYYDTFKFTSYCWRTYIWWDMRVAEKIAYTAAVRALLRLSDRRIVHLMQFTLANTIVQKLCPITFTHAVRRVHFARIMLIQLSRELFRLPAGLLILWSDAREPHRGMTTATNCIEYDGDGALWE